MIAIKCFLNGFWSRLHFFFKLQEFLGGCQDRCVVGIDLILGLIGKFRSHLVPGHFLSAPIGHLLA